MGDSWEWELADGVLIRARLELPARIESVWLGKRLVSRSAVGGKGEHHIVPLPAPTAPPPSSPSSGAVYRAAPAPREAEVTFDPIAALCTLRLDGAVVPPTREPDVAAAIASAAGIAPRTIFGMPPARLAIYAAATCFITGVLAGPGVFRHIKVSRLHTQIADVPTETERTESLIAPDLSIGAHYPADFDSIVDQYGAVISLHRPKKREMIVLISMPRTDLDDSRDLDRIMMKDLETFATKSKATMSTTITVPGQCQGFPGTVSTSTMSKPDQYDDIPQKIVGCSMLRAGRGYFFAYFVPEFLAEHEEPELRKIVDATDIYEVPQAPQPRIASVRAGSMVPTSRGAFDAFSPNGSPPSPQGPRISVFSQRGVVTTGGTATPRPIVRPNNNGMPSPAPIPTVRMVNGTAESSGTAYVYGLNPAADAERDRKMQQYRSRVPW